MSGNITSKRKRFNLLLCALLGITAGVGLFTFVYAKGYTYMLDDPNACANCHVMEDQLASWQNSSHHEVAACNDCHVPHDFIGKYWVKATNGAKHSAYFTLGNFPEPIQISEGQKRVTQYNCERCHEHLITSMQTSHEQKLQCATCHKSAGHK